MLFAEEHARLLLLVHTIVAAATVAASTHLVVWMRGFPRGRFERVQAVRKFATIAASLFVVTVLLGNAIYPVYKVRVRAEYLDQPSVVVDDYRERRAVRQRVAANYELRGGESDRSGETGETGETGPTDEEDPATDLPQQAASLARWFDVKEHWVALGMAMSLACMAILWAWNPKRHGRAIAPIVFLIALGAALSAWLGAIIGTVVASYRSIGGLG